MLFMHKSIKNKCVSVINLITDKRLDTTKRSILFINDRQIAAQYENLVLSYLSGLSCSKLTMSLVNVSLKL